MSDLEPFPELIEGRRLNAERINGVDPARLTIGAERDAVVTFRDEVAAFENVLGVYLIDPDGTIRDPEIVFARIEHADPLPGLPLVRPGGGPLEPGDAVHLNTLYPAADLEPGQQFGLFVVADGADLNPGFVFDGSGQPRVRQHHNRRAGEHRRSCCRDRAAPRRGRRQRAQGAGRGLPHRRQRSRPPREQPQPGRRRAGGLGRRPHERGAAARLRARPRPDRGTASAAGRGPARLARRPRRHQRLPPRWHRCGRLQRFVGRRGRGRQRRRLRRCHHRRSWRRSRRDTMPARATSCSAEPRGSVPASTSRPSTAPTASASTASIRIDCSGSRSPGPGTSMATASPISSSALPATRGTAGESYVVFGRASGFGASLDLATLDGTNGFRLDGIEASTVAAARSPRLGTSTATASPTSSSALLRPTGISRRRELRRVRQSLGLRCQPRPRGPRRHQRLSPRRHRCVRRQRLLGRRGRGRQRRRLRRSHHRRSCTPAGLPAGESYVVFGKASGFDASLDLATLDGTNGFRLDGIDAADDRAVTPSPRPGTSTATASTMSSSALRDARLRAGESYVVFGRASGFAASLDLATLDGTNGFRLDGIDAHAAARSPGPGTSTATASTISSSARQANRYGESYVVFGKASGFGASLDLATLDGTNGFRLDGIDAVTERSLRRRAGDVNGDGFSDLIIGAPCADYGRRRELRGVRRQLHRRGEPARRPQAQQACGHARRRRDPRRPGPTISCSARAASTC